MYIIRPCNRSHQTLVKTPPANSFVYYHLLRRTVILVNVNQDTGFLVVESVLKVIYFIYEMSFF